MRTRTERKQERPDVQCVWCEPGVLEIASAGKSTRYHVHSILSNGDEGELLGFRLVKIDGECHDVCLAVDPMTCTCQDATYRKRKCKHLIAIETLLNRAGAGKRKVASYAGSEN